MRESNQIPGIWKSSCSGRQNCARPGTLIIYDAAMQHRGGANKGATARPILAVHMRRGEGYGPPPA